MGDLKKVISTVVLTGCCLVWGSPKASAQCCLDIFGWGKQTNTAANAGAMPSYPYGAAYPVVPGSYPVVPAAATAMPGSGLATMQSGYMAPQPYVAGYAGVPQGVANVLPTTNYNTQYFNAAVTYYRPVVTTDPRTGKQVTTMMPCTSYQQQAQRVPACSLGQCLTGSPAPMVAAPPLPTATSSGNVMPPGSMTYPAPAAGYPMTGTTTNLPVINPTLPVYNTGVQPAYSAGSVPVQANYYSPVNSQLSYGATSANTTWPTTSNFGSTTSVTAPAPAPIQIPSIGGTYSNSPSSVVYPPNNTTTIPALGTGAAVQGSEIFPPSPSSVIPTPDGSSSTGIYPPAAAPFSGSVNPPSDSESRINIEPKIPASPNLNGEKTSDPAANEAPSLPLNSETNKTPATEDKTSLNGANSRLQNVVRQPSADLRDMSTRSIDRVGDTKTMNESNAVTSGSRPIQNTVPVQEKSSQSQGRDSLVPELKPIPLPEGFESEPKWNPGLLNSSDKTALRNSTNSAVTQLSRLDSDRAKDNNAVVWAGYRDGTVASSAAPSRNINTGRGSQTPTSTKSRYDDSGWKTSRSK